MEVRGQLHALAALPVGVRTLGTHFLEAEWAPEPVWTQWRRETIPASVGN